MRRPLTITLFAAAILTVWFCRGLTVNAQLADGTSCATTGDINGDCATDISDAIYLLRYLFNDGPEPRVACADGPDERFARSVVGSYYLCLATSDGTSFNGTSTIGADHTDLTHVSTAFSGGGLGRFLSPILGTWEKTGERRTTHTGLYFAYDAEGNQTAVARSRTVVTWREDASGYSGTWTQEVFELAALVCGGADAVPGLDPAARPIATVTGTVRAGLIGSR